MTIKFSYENLAIKKDLIKLIEKWRRILGANIILNITVNEQKGVINFKLEVKEFET